MAVQDDQLGALRSARDKIVRVRTDRLTARENCDHDVQGVGLALSRIENRLAVLAIQCDDYEKSAKSLSDAWLGIEMPQLVRADLDEKHTRLKRATDEIDKLKKSHDDLTDERDSRRAALRLAQDSLDKAEAELRQVDQRITEIRGF